MPPRTPRDSQSKSMTIKDVAREAGVSVASVSRVMNGHDNVLPETRERILRVVERLRYSPHIGARELITKRTRVIGVLLPDLHGEFFSELIRGIDVAAREQKLHFLLSGSHGDAAEMVEAIQAMRGRVEGLLIMAPHLDASLLSDRIDPATQVVFMNSRVGSSPSLSIDSYQGARAMVRHLVACGHRSIAHLCGPADNFDSHERLRGYRDELTALLPEASPMVLQGDFTEASGRAAARLLATMPGRPAALFAGNDMMAIGCLAALEELGISVPGQLAVAGFDDIPLATFVRPKLTTMRADIAELGRTAMRRLAAAIDGRRPLPEDAAGREARGTPRAFAAPEPDEITPQQLLRPEPVVRESCGAPPSARAAVRSASHGELDEVDPRVVPAPPIDPGSS